MNNLDKIKRCIFNIVRFENPTEEEKDLLRGGIKVNEDELDQINADVDMQICNSRYMKVYKSKKERDE